MILLQTKPVKLSVLHHFLFSFMLFFLGVMNVSAQDFNLFKGEILDSDSKKPLVFATLSVANSNISSISNAEGKFSLKIPKENSTKQLVISFLGYKTKTIAIKDLKTSGNNKIYLDITVTALTEINISAPKDPRTLVLETLKKRGENYFEDPTLMTAFYRESIKKRRKNISLSEAVVNIYKAPYSNSRKDAVELYKTRKSTNYSKMDTLALKLQGGPFNALYVDVMKYPQYIFGLDALKYYEFAFDHSTRINNRLVYVISFKQNDKTSDPLYKGKLYIDAEKKILTSAIYSLNITDKQKAAKLFVRKKPNKAKVWPTDVAYRVDYREKNNKWYYGYSSAILEFKIDWDSRLFNSVYSMSCEMAVTDWKKNTNNVLPKGKDKVKMSIILGDEAVGFSDPNFWGEYNIIEPEKSIESAIKKINRQLKRSKGNGSDVKP
ncbi:carboxypeptidase-like regulatory domain-containing protein [Cellulophaga sp. 3_MG-2023]|uniref:carboxypeptidase-like regulatory domain-containing protein n=2 Tax=unclassified Cellulophaga TaxID=2634405 RepID=UPI0026E3FDD0|nr:carboxypeptidase-like regulatory domain-containing protein [Cellulophaga sp. 3_MG-2023]MDO6492051.1 carboxypeptidase-like regulatory domain-containing protein [Cellulophaga sp. 2_MG-2023]MDO6495788.1 carboxypeptidase-like regulatory domain-containing protein [Cellulophaga sp. 3_MG-2023]